MRQLINLIEKATKARTVDDLPDYDGEAIKPNCTKCIPEEIEFADFCFAWWIGGSKKDMKKKRNAFTDAEKDITHEDVLHKDMKTGQICVNPEKIQCLLDEPTSKMPVIHRWKGHNMVFDGNHRLTADVLRGEISSKCIVFHMDKYFDEYGNLK